MVRSAAVAPDGRVAFIDPVRRELVVLGPDGVRRCQLVAGWREGCVFYAGENWFVRVWPLTLLVFDRELRPVVPAQGDASSTVWWSTDPSLSFSDSWGYHGAADGGFSFLGRGVLFTLHPHPLPAR